MKKILANSPVTIVESDYDRLAELIEITREALPEISLYMQQAGPRENRDRSRSSQRANGILCAVY